jgi:hypothetical protein
VTQRACLAGTDTACTAPQRLLVLSRRNFSLRRSRGRRTALGLCFGNCVAPLSFACCFDVHDTRDRAACSDRLRRLHPSVSKKEKRQKKEKIKKIKK